MLIVDCDSLVACSAQSNGKVIGGRASQRSNECCIIDGYCWGNVIDGTGATSCQDRGVGWAVRLTYMFPEHY